MKKECPQCGKEKKPWFKLCWDCTIKEKQKPICEICGISVPDGHTLCKPHWKEKEEGKKKLSQISYVKKKKEQDYREKFSGKYYFDSYKVKSKSELLICYFLVANGLRIQYEPPMELDGVEWRPDFVIDDQKGNCIILEHNGIEEKNYLEKKMKSRKAYEKFCNEEKCYFYVETNENDMLNLKEKLGKKLNETPLKRPLWK